MTAVAVLGSPGSGAVTTTAFLLSALVPDGVPVVLAEGDPSGGDLASWARLKDSLGWSSAVASGDRSWDGLRSHLQQLPSGLNVLVAPTHTAQAQVVTREAAKRFGPLLRSMAEVTVFVDCGRIAGEIPAWALASDLALLVVRQAASSEGATTARIDRARECLGLLHAARVPVGVIVIGARPYPPAEIASVLLTDVIAVLPEDPSGAALAAGAWTVGRGASRSPLARAARELSARLTEAIGGLGSVVPMRPEADSEALG
jgi:hypothetical protein